MLATLDARQSVAARVRERIDLLGHQFVGSGIYLQQTPASVQGRGSDRLLRYELKIQVADQVTNQLQVADGQSLWTRQEVLGRTTLSHIDLTRLRRALKKQEATAISPNLAWMALGGLPKLIFGLGQWFEFGKIEEGKLERFPVWIMRGEWKRNKLADMLPDQRGQILAGEAADLSKLPAQLPERVVLMIGRDDLFPYRLEYWRHVAPPAKVIGVKKPPAVDTLIVAMELYEVQLDVPLDPRQFAYNPGDQPAVDQTPAFLQSLGLKDEIEAKAPQPSAAGRR